MKLEKIAPWIAGGLALVGVAAGLRGAGTVRGFDVAGFAALPVLEGGRVKPLDSVARNSLLLIRSQQSFRHEGRTVGADEWLLDLMFRPQVADAQPVFVINDPEVLGLIGAPLSANRYYPFDALRDHLDEIEKQGQAVRAIEARERTRFQSAVLNLYERLLMYFRLRNTAQLDGSPGLAAEVAGRAGPQAERRHQALGQLAFFRPLLPTDGPKSQEWRSIGEGLHASASGPVDPVLAGWARAGAAYAAQDARAFNQATAELAGMEAAVRPGDESHAGHEVLFNRVQPFYAGMVIYIAALLALFASWLYRPALLQPVAFGLLLSGALVHTVGLVSRVVLQGRPPVTNLYSSAVFVGWVAVLLGAVLEWLHRRGFGTAVAAASGFASLIVAHHLAGDGDTMEMMRAVLDSNFWLATHVVTITIGYSGTFLAGALAIGYTVRKHVARRIDPETTRVLASMTYGTICFALLFSFVGTVLGGIWADQSWGRFWGWDPKENGALLIVLWNAIILHARWGRFVRDRGIMTMAIFGNVITSLSWFGVNMLGVGLHSYGFMDKAFWALAAFIGSQLLLMGVCLLPRRFWSAAARATAAGEPTEA